MRLAETLEEALGRRLSLPVLRRIAAGEAAHAALLPAILAQIHNILARERRLILLLDRLRGEVPEITASYRSDLRAGALRDFTRAIARLVEAGVVRRDLHPALAGRAVLELIAWMAMRRPDDPSQPPGPGDEDEALATTLALVEAALAAPGRRSVAVTPASRRAPRRSRRDASP